MQQTIFMFWPKCHGPIWRLPAPTRILNQMTVSMGCSCLQQLGLTQLPLYTLKTAALKNGTPDNAPPFTRKGAALKNGKPAGMPTRGWNVARHNLLTSSLHSCKRGAFLLNLAVVPICKSNIC